MSDEQREFWSNVARKYDRVVDLQIGPATRSLVRERLAKEGRLGRAAEFGCGTGYYTEVLASHSDGVVATDLSPGMIDLARRRIRAPNVTFQVEDAQRTSFPDAAFDTAFMSLVLHFTEPDQTLAEMRRILRPGGSLIVANLDPRALTGLDRIRSVLRIFYRGVTGYRSKPPRGFGARVMTERELRESLAKLDFEVVDAETIQDRSRSSHIPVEYLKATRVG